MGLEERVAELEYRVAALEEGRDPALSRLHQEFAEADEPHGGVLLAGTVRLPTGEEHHWQSQFTTDSLIEVGWDESTADCLAALGNPIRLQLLREILGGRRTAAELTELDGLGTTGQIYHHLRQLAAVGWLQTVGRGRFEVPAGRVVPLLIALASARR